MKNLTAAAAILALSSTLAIAQTTPNSGAATPNTGGVASPSLPSSAATTGSGASVGLPAGVNPSNPQDLSNRSNPQDLTKPGANNPQDMKR